MPTNRPIHRLILGLACWAIALATLAGPWAGPAGAQEQPRKRVAIFVLPSSSSEIKAALLMARVLRQNTEGLTGIDLVTPAPVLNSSALPQLQTMVDEAYKALNGKNVKSAMSKLDEAKALMEQILPIVPLRTVALFYKSWGVAQALNANLAEARSAIELSLTLWKEQNNLEYAYSVQTLQLYSSLASDLEGRSSATLSVETTPENAVVVVDNREPAQSPAAFANLSAGTHLLRISLDGHDQWAGFVRIQPGETNKVSVPLKAIPEKAVFDKTLVGVSGVIKMKKPEEAQPELLALLQFLGVDELLALECSVIGESYEMKGFHVKSDGSVFPAKRTFARDATFLAGIKEFLSGLFESFYEIARKAEGLGGPPIDPVLLQKAGITTEQTTTVFDPDNPVFPTVEIKKKKKKKIHKQWWFWTATIGGSAVVAGLVVLIWALSDKEDTSTGPTGTINVSVVPIE